MWLSLSRSCVRCRKRNVTRNEYHECEIKKRTLYAWAAGREGWVNVDDVPKLSQRRHTTRLNVELVRVFFPCCCFARPNFFLRIFFFFHSAQPPKTKSSQATFYSTVTPSRLIWKLNFQSAESRLCWSNIYFFAATLRFARSSRVNFPAKEYFNIISRFVFICTRISPRPHTPIHSAGAAACHSRVEPGILCLKMFMLS